MVWAAPQWTWEMRAAGHKARTNRLPHSSHSPIAPSRGGAVLRVTCPRTNVSR